VNSHPSVAVAHRPARVPSIVSLTPIDSPD
jgi:hypothetical protein